ncbi:uncharacterized protein [Physcomitrium patens]|uniref:uncharacterized protein isoform X2 n=1 Tax=Physcomitrium patens TaxID=3218 RepID=UPI000D171A5F|nr:uncharacterized protein LOC112280186 isoform X1 [Physcomitrium patens]|eukprot:XP_024371140.1 uncharacterized protein LOC112280186 isoform X1 [Physcomitrella patens]
MKKRSLSLGGRPSSLSHAAITPFPRQILPGYETAPRPIERVGPADVQYSDCGSQQESQSKHPFLPRSYNPYSSQSQRSLSQGCLTQTQNTQLRFSPNTQPQDYACDQSKNCKETSLSQPQKPPPYFAGLTSSLNRRNTLGNAGGAQTPASSTSASASLLLVGPQNNTPRPWQHCNVSEDIEKRLANLEKLREAEIAVIQKICDDYQHLKSFLEETCFENTDSRSKLSRQPNALHKLVKEEETANSSITTAIKALEETILQEVGSFQPTAQDVSKENAEASCRLITESLREELVNLKSDLKAEFHDIFHPVIPRESHHRLINQSSSLRKKSLESTPNHSPVALNSPAIVNLDGSPDSDFDSGLDFLVRSGTHLSSISAVKSHIYPIDKHGNGLDDDIRKSVRRKILRGRSLIRSAGIVVLSKFASSTFAARKNRH